MNLNNIKLILWREYWTRVRKKSFLLVTLLTPLAFLALFAGSALLGSGFFSEDKKIVLVDEERILQPYLSDNEGIQLSYSEESIDELKAKITSEEYDYILHIPPMTPDSLLDIVEVDIIGSQSPGIVHMESIKDWLSKAARERNIGSMGFTSEQIQDLDAQVILEVDVLKEGDSQNVSNAKIATGTAIGFAMGFLMYLIIFLYGSFVMRSVMEEKINRIVELIISAVKPIELMMGKILGIGMVAFTQVMTWVVLLSIGSIVLGTVLGAGAMAGGELTSSMEGLPAELPQNEITAILNEFSALPWGRILLFFIIFFIGGYLMYSSLFAAVGSAIGDDMAEGQTLTLPIAIPVIIALMMLFPTIEDPNGSIALFGSLFPLTSPLLMPARLVFEPPLWQVLLSAILLFGACLGLVWLSSKIYRGSILLYGKKLSFKNIWSLMRQ